VGGKILEVVNTEAETFKKAVRRSGRNPEHNFLMMNRLILNISSAL
jgi:hypothetical protein